MQPVLVATDLSPRADRAFRRAVRLAADGAAPLHAVYVIDHGMPHEMAGRVETAARRELERVAEVAVGGISVEPTLHVVQGDPPADVHALARALDAKLIVFGMHRPRPIIDAFRETTLERLVRRSRRPVLVVRDPPDHAYARLLAALDFSPAASRAAALAGTLFPDAQIRAFHAVHIPFQGLTDDRGKAADTAFYIASAKADLAAWAEQSGAAELAGRTEIAEGALHRVLRRQIEAWHPDLLVLGAHGRTGAAPFLLGSFANDMMRDPPCDLLIARQPGDG